MKIHYFFIILFTALILTGCKTDLKQFNKKVLEYANDNKIEQKEYEELFHLASVSEDSKFHMLKNGNGKIDNDKLYCYLLKYFRANKTEIIEKNIWKPSKVLTKKDLFNINVFLENSESMDGYVKGVTEFETAIYDLLGDIKVSGLCDSLNLNYINRSIPFSMKNVLPNDIEDFIDKLEPSTFKLRGGDRSVSDLKNLLCTILNLVNEKNVAVFISDFVFSPGKSANAQDYLNNQGVGIKIDFTQKLCSFDLSVVVIQLQSNFDGKYFDKANHPIQIKCKRPYYIWLIGNTKQIAAILDRKLLDNIKGGYINRLVFQSIDKTTNIPIKIQSSPLFGTFKRKDLAKGTISGATLSKENKTKGKFGFCLAVDFSSIMQDANYFLDAKNYSISNNKYQLKVETISEQNDVSLSGFTHLLKLHTMEIKDESLQIKVIGCIPDWVYKSTSIDDVNLQSDDTEKQKTFGLKFLIEGVGDAFYPKAEDNSITTLTITINK